MEGAALWRGGAFFRRA